jgi:hypothetical protein
MNELKVFVYHSCSLSVHPDPSVRCDKCGKRPWISRVLTPTREIEEQMICECEDQS